MKRYANCTSHLSPTTSTYSFALLCVAVAGSFLLGESVTSAQGQVVYACASNSTGAIRVVFGGSLCKSNESPLQWNVAGQPGPAGPVGSAGPQGEPGEENVVAVGTSVFAATNSGPKSVTIPVLGTVEVRCDAGVPKITMNFAGTIKGRRDEVNGGTEYIDRLGSAAPLVLTTTPGDFSHNIVGRVGYYWITSVGIDAVWKVDVYLRPYYPESPIASEYPCTAAASITTMK